ncbi:MAG: prefoldin subunit alpha [Thermoplasmata archaeon]
MSTEDEEKKELENSLITLEYYKAQLEVMSKQNETLGVLLSDYLRAKDTLENFKKLKGDDSILIPIGATVFVFAKITDPSKAITNIGADVLSEESVDSVIGRLEKKIDDTKDLGRKLEENALKIQQQMTAISQRAQELYQKSQREQ